MLCAIKLISLTVCPCNLIFPLNTIKLHVIHPIPFLSRSLSSFSANLRARYPLPLVTSRKSSFCRAFSLTNPSSASKMFASLYPKVGL